MKKRNLTNKTGRRQFLGNLTAGAATLGMSGLVLPFQELRSESSNPKSSHDAEDWFKKITGKHRIVFDLTRPTVGLAPFSWARAFLISNEETGSPASECNVVIVFRHEGIPFAFNSDIWAKYKFGETFKYDDPTTKQPAVRNPFWQPAQGQFIVPGNGVWALGINQLQESGVMFCVCNMAIKKHVAVMAQSMHLDPNQVKKEWLDGLLPGVELMPAGVWAVGRAQEHGCTYCFTS